MSALRAGRQRATLGDLSFRWQSGGKTGPRPTFPQQNAHC
jgi:hypothetical protein